MNKPFKAVLYIFLVINLSVATTGFMAWTARRVLPPEPPMVRTFPNCAEYFFDSKGDFHLMPSRKGSKYVNFRASDLECGG